MNGSGREFGNKRNMKGVHGMKRVILLLFTAAALGTLVVPAGAEQYWLTYEGNDLPENEGWTRYWGNNDGEYQGGGAVRTIEDGVLAMDSRHDPWLWDFNFIERPDQMDPGSGETFVMEWRLKAEEVVGDRGDPLINVASDEYRTVGYVFREDQIWCYFEDDLTIPITPGVYHDYRFVSSDMLTYDLYIDGELVHEGTWWQGVRDSRVGWGTNVRPATSLAHWDYVRFGVIPEPKTVFLILVAMAFCHRRLTEN